MRKKIPEIIFSLLFCFVVFLLFAKTGQDIFYVRTEIPKLDCTSYAPYVDDINQPVTIETIREDLLKIKPYTDCVRIYSTKNGLYAVPVVADELGMKVILGVWIDKVSRIENQKEIDRAVLLANTYSSVKMIVLGNEVAKANWGKIDKQSYLQYLNDIKGRTSKPISMTGFITSLIGQEDVLEKIDVVGLHVFPYWDGVNTRINPNYVLNVYDRLEKHLKKFDIHKPIQILEYGNPWTGLTRMENTPTLTAQRQILIDTTKALRDRGIFANFYELLAEKRINDADGYLFRLWGVLTSEGVDTIFSQRRIYTYMVMALILLVVFQIVWYVSRSNSKKSLFNTAMYGMQIFVIYGLTLYSTYVVRSIYGDSFFWRQIWHYVLLFVGMCIYLRYINELSFVPKINSIRSVESVDNQDAFVSIHIPSAAEDVSMLRNTILSCLAQTYKNFEIILINNGAQTSEYTKKVVDMCNGLNDDRLRYVYFNNIHKNKGAALDYACKNMNSRTTHVFILDADYQIIPTAIERGLSCFTKDIDVVLYPQVYRCEGSFLSDMTGLEQLCIQKISQPYRQSNNTVIVNGTLCFIRRKVFDFHVWNHQTICEDAMFGADLQIDGCKVLYIDEELGKGFAPKNMRELFNQRIRWVIGAVQILRHMLSDKNGVCNTLFYKYLSGWLSWLASILLLWTLPFYIAYFTGHLPMIHLYLSQVPIFTYIGLLAVFIGIVGFLKLKNRLHITVGKTVKFMFFELALMYTVCLGILIGLISRNKVFITTRSKGKNLLYNASLVSSFCFVLILVSCFAVFLKRSLYLDSWITIFNTVIPIILAGLPFLAHIALWAACHHKSLEKSSK